MSIVLDEYEWAEQAINDRQLGKKPIKTLSRVARYYYENGYKKRDVRNLLDTFMLQCDPNTNLSQWSNTLDKIAKGVDKYALVRLDGISITKGELKKIEDLGSWQLRRLAFTLLCVAKYWDCVSSRNNHWANSADDEIVQMANIHTSIKRQSALFSKLRDAGLIKFSKKIDNLNVQVLFVEDGETELYIQDFRNLGYQYLKYCGGAYFDCVNCGLTVKIQKTKGRHQKYCPSCAAEIQIKQKINFVVRHRKTLSSQNVEKNRPQKSLVPQGI